IECINKGSGWNVHLHALVEGGFVRPDHIAQDWYELTGDSYIVHSTSCYEPEGALKYILKYLLKAPTLSGRAKEYNAVLKGRRLIQTFGSWYKRATLPKEEKQPKLVCSTCGHAAWIVMIQRQQGKVFFTEQVRAG